ncbi:MAG TPA: hypothetical protein VLH84_04465 [Patescibacteria group bacterium]|nr:hypothetical protein [Patescibacteria group bacterium]
MSKPYVISAELDLAGAGFEEIVDPQRVDDFRQSLDAELRSYGKQVQWVDSATLKDGLAQRVAATRLPTASLDQRFVHGAAYCLGISRAVDDSLQDVGYVPRAGFPAIQRQLDELAAREQEVVVVDDVLFSGEMLHQLRTDLAARGVRLSGVICGIAIGEGAEKLEAEGIGVDAVLRFDDVDDEICERDFAVVPGSGRRLSSGLQNAFYFDNLYGRPSQWASIPAARVADFCVNSLERNSALLRSEVPMDSIGNFVGYQETGAAVAALYNRIERISL